MRALPRSAGSIGVGRKCAVGVSLVLIICILSFGALLLGADYSTPDVGSVSLSPSSDHPFGTDTVGRDVFARTLVGGAYSVGIALSCTLITTLAGTVFGAFSGYFGGYADTVLLRLSEFMQSVPFAVSVLLFAAVTGKRGIGALIAVFSATGWMTVYRIVRTEFVAYKRESFVTVARRAGMSHGAVIFGEILPNVLAPVTVAAVSNTAYFILQEAALSFIGFGVPESVPTWGNMLNAARSVAVVSGKWWIWLFPGIACALFVLGTDMAVTGVRKEKR